MDDDGFELEEELREIALLLDPVPAELFDDAMLAFTLRTLDGELAELTFDSWDELTATRVRGGDRPRLLTFEAGGVVVEVEISGSRLVGRVLRGTRVEIGVQRPDGEIRVRSDDLGRFTAESPGTGPLRLRVICEEGATVTTSWIRV